MEKIIIFDLDGVLANIEHRKHFIKNKPKNFRLFNEECNKDLPIYENLNLFNKYLKYGYECRIWSGRSNGVRQKTIDWLSLYLNLTKEEINKILLLRPTSVFISSDQLKLAYYNKCSQEVKDNIELAIDDDPKNIKMYKNIGIKTMFIDNGEF